MMPRTGPRRCKAARSRPHALTALLLPMAIGVGAYFRFNVLLDDAAAASIVAALLVVFLLPLFAPR